MNRMLAIALVLAVAAGGAWYLRSGGSAVSDGPAPDPRAPIVSTTMHGMDAARPPRPADQIVVPELTRTQEAGRVAFEASCAVCHGLNGAGTESGPPFVHPIYEPGHHGDFAFASAVKNGVRAHHWRFGDMPPVAGVGDLEIATIVAYVRALQRANGID